MLDKNRFHDDHYQHGQLTNLIPRGAKYAFVVRTRTNASHARRRRGAIVSGAGASRRRHRRSSCSTFPTIRRANFGKLLNAQFAKHYGKQAGVQVTVKQSHGGSSSQARSVAEGLKADVVTLAMPTDTDTIRKAGLINQAGKSGFPMPRSPIPAPSCSWSGRGIPSMSRIGRICIRNEVEVITPSPKTSGNGKLSFLAAWGSVTRRGGSEAQALTYVTELYRHVPVLDTAARGSTTTFRKRASAMCI